MYIWVCAWEGVGAHTAILQTHPTRDCKKIRVEEGTSPFCWTSYYTALKKDFTKQICKRRTKIELYTFNKKTTTPTSQDNIYKWRTNVAKQYLQLRNPKHELRKTIYKRRTQTIKKTKLVIMRRTQNVSSCAELKMHTSKTVCCRINQE